MKRPDRYRYPAVLGFDTPTKQYYVLWPDLPGCTTTAGTEEEALENAREAKQASLNYSQILQDGIMERLKISRTVTRQKRERVRASV